MVTATVTSPGTTRRRSSFNIAPPAAPLVFAPPARATPPAAPKTAGAQQSGELARSVLSSVVNGHGQTFTVEAPDAAAATDAMSGLRTLILAMRMTAGSVSATIAPSFYADTFPAMAAMVRALEHAGLGGAWKPEGVRSLRVDKACHVFISADRPSRDPTPAPDTLLEVAGAHRIPLDWYQARVAPRTKGPRLTRVIFGLPGHPGSVYQHMVDARPTARDGLGGQLHFSIAPLA